MNIFFMFDPGTATQLSGRETSWACRRIKYFVVVTMKRSSKLKMPAISRRFEDLTVNGHREPDSRDAALLHP